MSNRLLNRCSLAFLGCWIAGSVCAQGVPRIAVTDLSYQEQVSQYFSTYQAHETLDSRASSNERFRDSDFSSSGSANSRQSLRTERSVNASSGMVTMIDRGELRKFIADVKGELIKSGAYRVTQGRPWTQTNTEKLYDIIDRIKHGFYPGADYVLFGSVTSIEFRNEANPIQGTNATNYSLSLDLVAEFSLIDTRTYEVKAGFSASGAGVDARLVNAAGQTFHLNRGKVMQEVSRTLGQAVASEMESQFGGAPLNRNSFNERTERIQREERTTLIR